MSDVQQDLIPGAVPDQALAAPGGIDYSAAVMAATQLGKDGVDALERIEAMQIRAEERQNIRDFHAAMARAQVKFDPLLKKKKGVHDKLYVTFPQIMEMVKPVLAEEGIYVTFDEESVDGKPMLAAIAHGHGHSERAHYPLVDDPGGGKAKIHAIASGNTYAMRYAVLRLLGLSTVDPDDDGCAAAEPLDVVTDDQALELEALARDVGATVKQVRDIWTFAGCDSFVTMPAIRFREAKAMIHDIGGQG